MGNHHWQSNWKDSCPKKYSELTGTLARRCCFGICANLAEIRSGGTHQILHWVISGVDGAMAKHPTDFIQQNSERTMQTVDVGLNWFRETAADLQAQQGCAGGAA
jgi:hypothetical protein